MTEKYDRAERKCSMDAALALLKINRPVELVAKYTQLPIEDVEQLRRSGELPADIRDLNAWRAGLDENETAILRSRLKYLTDLVSNFYTARDEGFQQGLAEGRAEGRAEIARNLLKIALPVEQIVEITGMTIEEVARLRTFSGPEHAGGDL